MQPWS